MRLQNEITFIGFIGRTCICLCCFPLSFCKDFSGSPTIIFYSQFFLQFCSTPPNFGGMTFQDPNIGGIVMSCHVMSAHLLRFFFSFPDVPPVVLFFWPAPEVAAYILPYSSFLPFLPSVEFAGYILTLLLYLLFFSQNICTKDSHHMSSSLLFKRGGPVEGFGGVMMIGK